MAEEELKRRIKLIIDRCNADLEEDEKNGGDRQSYCQIKAFHYDSIVKMMEDNKDE